MTDSNLKVRVFAESPRPTDETFPQVTKALLVRLEQIFPDRCPDLNTAEREIWFKAGQINVVSYLRVEYERQQNKG